MFTRALPQAQLPTNITYLASDYHKQKHCVVHTADQFSDPSLLLEAYHLRARKLVEIASDHYQEALTAGMDNTEAWNESSIDWTIAAQVSL